MGEGAGDVAGGVAESPQAVAEAAQGVAEHQAEGLVLQNLGNDAHLTADSAPWMSTSMEVQAEA